MDKQAYKEEVMKRRKTIFLYNKDVREKYERGLVLEAKRLLYRFEEKTAKVLSLSDELGVIKPGKGRMIMAFILQTFSAVAWVVPLLRWQI